MKTIESKIVNFIISEKTVISVIMLNAAVMFLDAFPDVSAVTSGRLIWIDYCCVIYFIIEAVLKMMYLDSEEYWDNNWNRFDFFVVITSTPTLLEPFFDVKIFSAILILRLGRLARFFKLLRFVPDGPKIWLGVKRALKASIAVFLALLLLNIIFSMGATILFASVAPEYFANPLISAYTMFKVFTIEGWYSVPDEIAARAATSAGAAIAVRIYFMIAVVIGGILGLSIANAVFVDEMTSDNTLTLEKMLDAMQAELHNFRHENAKNRKLANDQLTDAIEHLRRENLKNREEANVSLLKEIEAIKKIIENGGGKKS
ncbi:MAG TPA: ion transporter [Candidatus Wallbacteria bacterium]|nr:ion transporter [Candidatus Wallbacteria bacterium]